MTACKLMPGTGPLTEQEKDFLNLLVHSGGACTRADAARALGVRSLVDVNPILQSLVKRNLLTAAFCEMKERPVIFFATLTLLRWYKGAVTAKRDLKSAMKATFQFAVALESKRMPEQKGQINLAFLPVEPLRDVVKSLVRTIQENKEAKLVVWTPCTTHVDKLRARLPQILLSRITEIRFLPSRLYTAYAQGFHDPIPTIDDLEEALAEPANAEGI